MHKYCKELVFLVLPLRVEMAGSEGFVCLPKFMICGWLWLWFIILQLYCLNTGSGLLLPLCVSSIETYEVMVANLQGVSSVRSNQSSYQNHLCEHPKMHVC